MALNSEIRRSDRYEGNGTQTEFHFAFKVLSATDIDVKVAVGEESEKSLAKESYSVTLNADQDNNPGGAVTLVTPLEKDAVLVVISDAPYLQPTVLTNRGGFYPETLNMSLDRLTIQTQQLAESLSRAVKVGSTDAMTPDELKQLLLSAQSDAQEAANLALGYKAEAEAARDAILGQQSTVISAVVDKGNEALSAVAAEGDAQAARLEQLTEEITVGYGVSGAQRTWAIDSDVGEKSVLYLPDGMTYIAGRNHLRLSWNGLILYPVENYEEIGSLDEKSARFRLLFAVHEGDVLNAWTVPLGRGDVSEAMQEVAAIRDSVAEISRTVAYREAKLKEN